MKPDDWVKLLYTYGPFALLAFFMAFGETRARSAVKDPGVNKKVSITVYAANWVVIFVLMAFALSAWYRLTFDTEYTIRGTLLHLQGAETLASLENNLYLSRRYGPGGQFDYAWRLVTPKRLQEGDRIPFLLELGTPESEKTRNYTLPIHTDFYNGDVVLSYDRLKDKLTLQHAQSQEELPPEAVATEKRYEAPNSLFTWKVEAQAAAPMVPIPERLEAGDPIIRQQAQEDLSKQTEQQWQIIEHALANPASSYRLKLGVLTAMRRNKCTNLDKLSPAALSAVILASGDPDPTLRGVARGCLITQASPAIEAGLDKAIRGSTGNAKSTGELARTQLEVLYALGIAAKDRYGSRQTQDRKEFDRAVASFQKAWGLRDEANPQERVVFAKALYGWGLALHDRSWIERDASHLRRPGYVRAAQEKFSEFLKEVQNSGAIAVYPYPQHLRQAEAYLRKPEPDSLQIN
jgi:hypothetical protein